MTRPAFGEFLLESPANRPRLRVGLLLDSTTVCAAFAEVIDHLRRSSFVELCLIVLHIPAPSDEPPLPPPGRLRRMGSASFWRTLGWSLYGRLDARAVEPSQDPLTMVDCAAALTGIEILPVTPISTRFVHRFRDEDVAAVKQRDLDVLIRFGFNILKGDVLQSARYGIWSFHHGDNTYYRGGPPHFWEMVEAHPLSGVIVQVLTEELDAGMVLAKGNFGTQPGFSLARNRLQPYWGGTHLMIQKLRELHRDGWPALQSRAVVMEPYQGHRKLYRAPTTMEIVHWLAPAMARKVLSRCGRVFSRAREVYWEVAIGLRQAGAPLLESPASLQPIPAPRGHFFADPFLIEVDGRTHLFVEDFDYRVGRAVIAHAELSASTEPLGDFQTVLDPGVHASYPCVFRHEDEFYMIPETAQAGSVSLYRADPFPARWVKVRDLLPYAAVDTTPLFHEGRWWFFTTLLDPHARAAALFLFSTADLLGGPLELHPRSPIVLDARFARCGGAVVRDGEALYRVSQDGARRYGRAFALHRVEVLNETEYHESLARVVEAEWRPDLLGTHTYTVSGRFEAIDVQSLRRARELRVR